MPASSGTTSIKKKKKSSSETTSLTKKQKKNHSPTRKQKYCSFTLKASTSISSKTAKEAFQLYFIIIKTKSSLTSRQTLWISWINSMRSLFKLSTHNKDSLAFLNPLSSANHRTIKTPQLGMTNATKLFLHLLLHRSVRQSKKKKNIIAKTKISKKLSNHLLSIKAFWKITTKKPSLLMKNIIDRIVPSRMI